MYRAMMIVCAFALVVSFAGQTQAADGNLSSDMLASMGLSDMQGMSDVQGQEVRGKGYYGVFGASFAYKLGYTSGSGSVNAYGAAGGFYGGVNAGGSNNSYAGNYYGQVYAGGSSGVSVNVW